MSDSEIRDAMMPSIRAAPTILEPWTIPSKVEASTVVIKLEKLALAREALEHRKQVDRERLVLDGRAQPVERDRRPIDLLLLSERDRETLVRYDELRERFPELD